MRQSLQSKFNLLGLLLVAFFLLMLPMFSQVKADTRDSLKEARNTALYKWTRELAKDFKPPKDLDDTKVEDYWDEYQKEAREANEDCPACNPDGDADGDNITNKDEVEQGRNPLCNEEEKGVEHCQNADDKNITDPDDVLDRVPRVELLNETWTSNDCGIGAIGFFTSCGSGLIEVNQTFRALEAYLNVSNYSGFDWRVDLSGGSGEWDQTGQWSDSQDRTGTYNGYAKPTGTGVMNEPPEETYSASLNVQGATQGTWHLVVYGIR